LEGFGTAASQLLEAELVTADGRIRIVNPRRDPDLFWAPKGGGGGTFGVVTRVTLRTHDLPTSFGSITATEFSTTIGCASDRSPAWNKATHLRRGVQPDGRTTTIREAGRRALWFWRRQRSPTRPRGRVWMRNSRVSMV
jgi:hypothetical protein